MSFLSAIKRRYQEQSQPLKAERQVELAVLALFLLLLLQILWNAIELAIEPRPAAVLPTEESLQVGALSSRQGLSAEHSAELRARPLFFASRRPELPDAEVVAKTSPEPEKKRSKPPQLTLVGAFGAGQSQGIIAVHQGQLLRLKVGDELSGWSLKEVSRDSAVLSNNGELHSVSLRRTDTGITPELIPEADTNKNGNESAPSDDKQDTAAKPGGLSLGG